MYLGSIEENTCQLKEVMLFLIIDFLMLQMLKGLCTAGAQLSHCLGALACHSSACQARAVQCRAMWDHLSSATTAATAVVKSQAIASLQEAHTGTDIDSDQAETNQVSSQDSAHENYIFIPRIRNATS